MTDMAFRGELVDAPFPAALPHTSFITAAAAVVAIVAVLGAGMLGVQVAPDIAMLMAP